MDSNLISLIDNLSMLTNLYDVVRIVDPLIKKTIYYDKSKGKVEISNNNCYDFWKSSEYCPNCISIRAYNENDTFVKIEYNKEKIYMLMASPITIGDKKYIFEMFKDITDTGIIENIYNKTVAEIQYFIKEMNDKIIKDELTGIYNKRFIYERLPIEILKSKSLKFPLSIIMTDIDFFKSVNDNYGHLAGDFILFEFASLIKSSIRKDNDWVARYGGEEFIIVLVNTDNNTAFKISEKIRKAVEEKVFEFDDNKIQITSSFGIYTLDENNFNLDIKAIIKYADEKLYEAKRTGRNKSIK
ncbi:GGDEF domain-containing protein [Clostridium cylindrosporum]|uniref:Diguanylate cyclase (GGDEF) domain-containing protein n=1 Tax=Clostridium cylindrosporum DSM 605 TaxID=1121307 RepID=A0A0J8DAS9_CLOCY|nr:GGDEF domain-containing protein [Clostridium cylindrosporum]KMT22957.1 diguanylate cyclase (GGDEF) domain-containing protein [Clostridium cylindrosporum DSM 605]